MAIINSLLDIDFYKLTMLQLVVHQFPDVHVKYSFHCRTPGARLTEFIDRGRLKEEFDHVCGLAFRSDELGYLNRLTLNGCRLFEVDFLAHLRRLRLLQYNLETVNDTFKIEFEGNWAWTMLWETICLSIVNELYFDSYRKKAGIEPEEVIGLGLRRLANKEVLLAECPVNNKASSTEYPGVKVTDFGTRRRYSRLWHEIVVDTLLKNMPEQFIGTSNVHLAKTHDLEPKGTMSHGLDQAMQGIILKESGGDYSQLVHTHDRVMDAWEKEYGYDMRINLPDTFGSDWALERMTEERLRNWKGERHDSGDPHRFTNERIKRWRGTGIDPRTKWIIYSDGLEVDRIIHLHQGYSGLVNVGFGWGTNLTNDMGFRPLSIVVKLTEANGYGTVKLSDNLAKAIGTAEDIERAKEIFEHHAGHEEVKY